MLLYYTIKLIVEYIMSKKTNKNNKKNKKITKKIAKLESKIKKINTRINKLKKNQIANNCIIPW